LGIGSFATATSIFKLRKLVKDEVLPGTLNVGITLPTMAQAFIYISIVEVDMTTLILLIAASVLGMWLGCRNRLRVAPALHSDRNGVALLGGRYTVGYDYLSERGAGGLALDLHGVRLWVGIAGNFALGALMSLGIGLYGPCLIMISLLGMDPRAAFPIMMGSCAFLMPVGSARFIRKGSYDVRASLGLALGGIPAVPHRRPDRQSL